MTDRFALRLVAPFVLLSLLFLASGGAITWYLVGLRHETSDRLTKAVAILDAADHVAGSAHDLELGVAQGVVTDEKGFGDLTALWKTLMARLEDAEMEAQGVLDPSLAGVRLALDNFFRNVKEMSEGQDAGAVASVTLLFRDRFTPQVEAPIRTLVEAARELVSETSSYSNAAARKLGYLSLVVGGLGALGGLLAGYAGARRVRRSLGRLSVPVLGTAGALAEIVGPIEFDVDAGLTEIGGVLEVIAERAGAVVRRLRQSEQEAMRSEQLAALGKIAADLAHEVLNPLTSIKIIVQTGMEQGGRGGISPDDLAVIHGQILRLERYIRSFLVFSRPADLERARTDLREAVRGAADLMRARADRHHTRLEIGLPDRPVEVDVDAEQMGQVVLNLVGNSLEALGRGGRVTVELGTAGPDGEVGQKDVPTLAVLTVGDDGPGIEEDDLTRVFEPFFSTKESGTGLGLSITRRIVESHGGTIEAGNAPGGGARFTVRVPLTGAAPRVAEPDGRESPRGVVG